MTRLAQAGLGKWGQNLLRNFNELAEVALLCDIDERRRGEFARRYPNARVTADFDELLLDDAVEGVVVATPVPTHYELARRALEAGKHVFVEKPPAMRGAEMEELCELAEEPSELWAHGHAFLNPGVEDVVFCYLRFPSGKIAHLHLSWLDPHKIRRITVVGRDKMAVFDDMELERKVTVYDKAPWQPAADYGEWMTRTGPIYSPNIPNDEPLKLECQHFLTLVRGEGDRVKPARDGATVVRALEQLQNSLAAVPA